MIAINCNDNGRGPDPFMPTKGHDGHDVFSLHEGFTDAGRRCNEMNLFDATKIYMLLV